VIAPLVVVIISVANSVHIISLFKQSLQINNDSFPEAMCTSLKKNFNPVLLAALTTSIGFLSLRLSSSPAIQGFGLIVAVGILYAFLFTFTLLPNLLIQPRFLHNISTATVSKSKLENLLEKVSTFALRYDKKLFAVFSLISITTLPLLGMNDSNFDRFNFISGGAKIKEPYKVVREQLNRGSALVYGIDTGEIDGAITPKFLKDLEEYLSWATELSAVESTASLIDVAKAVNQNQHQGKIEYFRIPGSTDAVANALLAYEVVESFDFPLKSFVTEDFSTLQLRINAAPLTNQEMIDLDKDLVGEFNARFPGATLLHGSPILLFARMDERVTVELLQGYSVSLILITMSLIIGFRSLYFGILSVLPNLLPATIVFGLWGLIVGLIDPFVMMLFSISIGLVVDDTVHLLTHYLEKRRENIEDRDAIASAIKIAGPALTITTFILALGCMMLIGAKTLYFQQAARLLVPIVVVALILDLLYLPALLKRLSPSVMTKKHPA
jgi:predicted RND superfamily exporter protein